MHDETSQFTIDDLIVMLEGEALPYERVDMVGTPGVTVRFCCEYVPHALRIVVDAAWGYCSIYQHDLAVCSTGVVPPAALGEACRFALMLNGAASVGGFMLYGHRNADLSFGTVIPTLGGTLTMGQLRQAISAICAEIDDFYPLLQQVLWGTLTADTAYAEFHRRLHAALDQDAEAAPAQPETDVEQVDEAFLRSYDRTDPFSAAAAEAILRCRGDGDEAAD